MGKNFKFLFFNRRRTNAHMYDKEFSRRATQFASPEDMKHFMMSSSLLIGAELSNIPRRRRKPLKDCFNDKNNETIRRQDAQFSDLPMTNEHRRTGPIKVDNVKKKNPEFFK